MVVSADALSAGVEDELFVVVPLSATHRPTLLRPIVPKSTGLDASSVAVCRAVRGVSRSRLLRRIGELDSQTLRSVDVSLTTILGLDG